MAEVFDTAGDAIDAFDGTETEEQAFFELLDFSAKEVAVAAAQRVGGEAAAGGWPTHFHIECKASVSDHSNFGTISSAVNGWRSRIANDQDGAWVEWNVALAAGTWAIDIYALTFNGAGILTFTLDADEIGSADLYAADLADFVLINVTDDYEVTDSGYYTLRATVDGKNASSSSFDAVVYQVMAQQVAAP